MTEDETKVAFEVYPSTKKRKEERIFDRDVRQNRVKRRLHASVSRTSLFHRTLHIKIVAKCFLDVC